MRWVTVLGFLVLLVVSAPVPAAVTIVVEDVRQMPASSGSLPLARLNIMRVAPDGSGRVFVNDLNGPFYVIDAGVVQTYMDFSLLFPNLKTSPGLGSGFVSFALDPEFGTNGLFYTVHSEFVGTAAPNITPPLPISIVQHAVLTEWTASNPAANLFTGTSRELMRVASPHHFHNMGEIAFDPYATPADSDYRLLYIGNGEYGAVTVGRPDQLQRLDTVWGAILRIDPDGTPFQRGGTTYPYGIPPTNPFVDGDANTFDEIYAYGFRNTHRLAWDPNTGNLYGSDIGESNFEEINLIVPGGNYGWPLREGNMAINPTSPVNVFPLPGDDATFGFSYPVALYDHVVGNAIAGGFPYRGSDIPDLNGKFLFGDVVNGLMFSADIADLEAADDGDPSTLATVDIVELVYDDQVTSLLQIIRDALSNGGVSRADLRFALDSDGELLITTKQDGFVRRLVAPVGVGPGRVPATLSLDKLPSAELRLVWELSVCSAAADYAIYEGTIGDWASHESLLCSDSGVDFEATIVPGGGSRYYLVVPLENQGEGSYGLDFLGAERPPAAPAAACRTSQLLGCP